MKNFAISFIILLTTMISLADAQVTQPKSAAGVDQSTETAQYRLFPTQNMWTFIKLNTRNGQMWQVQYDVKENNRLQVILNLIPLVSKEEEKNGRFTLYATQNIFTFILLDQITGKVWQVQWSTELEKRLTIPIE